MWGGCKEQQSIKIVPFRRKLFVLFIQFYLFVVYKILYLCPKKNANTHNRMCWFSTIFCLFERATSEGKHTHTYNNEGSKTIWNWHIIFYDTFFVLFKCEMWCRYAEISLKAYSWKMRAWGNEGIMLKYLKIIIFYFMMRS